MLRRASFIHLSTRFTSQRNPRKPLVKGPKLNLLAYLNRLTMRLSRGTDNQGSLTAS
jgi:hypothetical protein